MRLWRALYIFCNFLQFTTAETIQLYQYDADLQLHPPPHSMAIPLATLFYTKFDANTTQVKDMEPLSSATRIGIVHYTGSPAEYHSVTIPSQALQSGRFQIWCNRNAETLALSWQEYPPASVQNLEGDFDLHIQHSGPPIYLEPYEKRGRPPPVRQGANGGVMGMIQGLINPSTPAPREESEDKAPEEDQRSLFQK